MINWFWFVDHWFKDLIRFSFIWLCSYSNFSAFGLMVCCLKCLFRGFTKFSRTDYFKYKLENIILPDDVNAKLLGCHGPLANRQPGRAFIECLLVIVAED